MREARQRYYAALEHESAAQRLFDGQSGGPASPGRHHSPASQPEPWPTSYDLPAPTDVYRELGMKVYQAVGNLIGNLSEWGQRSGGWDVSQARRIISEALEPLGRDIETVQQRLERQEAVLNEIAAGMRRIDRFTLDAFQRLRGRSGYMDPGMESVHGRTHAGGNFPVMGDDQSDRHEESSFNAYGQERPPKRLAKEETVARALEAARNLAKQGRKLTLKSVAEAAGLKYSQIVYAFGSKDEMLDQVARHTVDVANAS